MNNNLVGMNKLQFRKKPEPVPRLNTLNIQHNEDHLARNAGNNLSCDDRNFPHRKMFLQPWDPNRKVNQKSAFISLSQTLAATSEGSQKGVQNLRYEEIQTGSKNPFYIKITKEKNLSMTCTLKKCDLNNEFQVTPTKNKRKSFIVQKSSFAQEDRGRINQFYLDINQNKKSYLQEDFYHQHHHSPQPSQPRNDKRYKTTFISTNNSPHQIEKQGKFDFFKTIKLRKETQKSHNKIPQLGNPKQLDSSTMNSASNQFNHTIKKSAFLPTNSCHKTRSSTVLTNQSYISYQPLQQEQSFKSIASSLSINNFQLLDMLGKGSIGEVYKAREKQLGFMCVIKKISKKKVKELKLEEMVIREIKLQSYLNNGHCTSIYGYFHDQEYVYLILQLLPDASLQKVKKKRKLPEEEAIFIIHQVAEGLKYLHSENVIHRDIKPQNIFMYQDYIKIGDFGCSIYHNNEGLRNSIVGSLEYFSPEQLYNEGYTEKIDSWCLGILSYELLFGKSPFQKQIKQVLNGQQRQFFSQVAFPQKPAVRVQAKDFIQSLLKKQPQERMDISEALAHPFLSEVGKE